MSELRRSGRVVKCKTFHDDRIANSDHTHEISASPIKKKAKLSPLEPVTLERVEKGSDLKILLDNPLPPYDPPLRLEYEAFSSHLPFKRPLELFRHFLPDVSLTTIVEATNSKALRRILDLSDLKDPRPWRPTISSEILRYWGMLFYMGQHREFERADYWLAKPHNLGRFMSKTRFEQIHRHYGLRDSHVHPRLPGEPYTYKVSFVAARLKAACQQAVTPASYMTIDESMLPFCGRSDDTVKMKNKPIAEGFKKWVQAFSGYVFDWLDHSNPEGPEDIGKKERWIPLSESKRAKFAPTFQVIIYLARNLRTRYPTKRFLFILDNLFINENVALALMNLNVGILGTTRKNAKGLPVGLLEAKETSDLLQYNSAVSIVKNNVLHLAWQDNNVVLGMTTSFSLNKITDTVDKDRRRPGPNSTNQKISRPVFGELSRKVLPIPMVINEYNQHMNGTDVSNQLRARFTCHRSQNYKSWVPHSNWILDIAANNAYLLWRAQLDPNKAEDQVILRSRRAHSTFHTELIDSLLATDFDIYAGHYTGRSEKRHACKWGLQNPGACVQQERRFGDLITNGTRRVGRVCEVQTYCQRCGVWLCVTKDCWTRYHAQKYQE